MNTSSPWGCSTQDYYNTPLSSRRHVPPNQTQLDPLARHLIINELKRAFSSPFTGEPHLYHDWIVSLGHHMEPLNISAYDKIDILLANTSGAPHEMIKTFKIAHRFDPDRAFNVIVSKLKERYGDEQQIARELKLKLQQFPVIKGSESDTSTASKLRELSDLCIIVKSHMEDIRDLNYYNLPSGIEEIRDKLPHFINTRWRSERAKYEQKYVFAPDFEVFCRFLEESSDIMCSDLLPRNKTSLATFTSMRPERRNARVLLVDNPDVKEASNNQNLQVSLTPYRQA